MSPRAADPAVRAALIAAATRLLGAGGPGELSTRRLAAEVGTSTMRIYTHFENMDDLHAAVRREGFARLAGAVRDAEGVDDPVAELAAGSLAYLDAATAEPELYRAMFNHRPPPGDDAGQQLFDLLAGVVRRCIEAGRFVDADLAPPACAGEIWAGLHGMVTLALAGILAPDALRFLLTDNLFRLAVGFGDDPEAVRRSIDAAARTAEVSR
ncbi:MAG: TetR/AcrR family transcriptional regulator [Micropruina sp.]|uniref:TetR/AcrR family transcriptional regulator n=1 Tax=Micropruina sp. TaxID=2737536 RepID=UPI0039E637F1